MTNRPRPLEVHRHERTRQAVGRRHSGGGDRAGLHRLRIIGQQRRRRSRRRPSPRRPHGADGRPTAAPTKPGRRRGPRQATSWRSSPAAATPSRADGTNPRISFTVPSGWAGNDGWSAKDYGDSGPVAPLVFTWPFDHGFKDPCTDHTPVVPAAGSGAAGLLGVIAGQPGIDAGPITDVTVGGHDGKYVDYTVTADPATCGNGEDPFWIWGTCPAPVTLGCEVLALGTGGTGSRRTTTSVPMRSMSTARSSRSSRTSRPTSWPPIARSSSRSSTRSSSNPPAEDEARHAGHPLPDRPPWFGSARIPPEENRCIPSASS